MERTRVGRRLRLALAALGAAAVLGPGGWIVTDVLESDNDFCNACHLSEGVPLHIDIRTDFDARPPPTLAAAHAVAADRGDERAFRCIDCHGGVGLLGRARVKALAAKDAFWYVVGDFEEPDHMRWPLLDEDCRQCHAAFAEKGDGMGGPAFHDLAVHNVRLGVACVDCHGSHGRQGDPFRWFLDAPVVRRECARCHPELSAGAPAPFHATLQPGDGWVEGQHAGRRDRGGRQGSDSGSAKGSAIGSTAGSATGSTTEEGGRG